jgi:hypothetical protein
LVEETAASGLLAVGSLPFELKLRFFSSAKPFK